MPVNIQLETNISTLMGHSLLSYLVVHNSGWEIIGAKRRSSLSSMILIKYKMKPEKF